MRIEEARRLMPGMKVKCPEDRNDPSFIGVVTQGAGDPHQDLFGAEYAWITVRDEARGTEAVWPSNRLKLLSPLPEPQPAEPEELPSP